MPGFFHLQAPYRTRCPIQPVWVNHGAMNEEAAAVFFDFIWRTYSAKATNAGIDLPNVTKGWIASQRKFVCDDCGAATEFKALIRAGCQPEMLSVLAGALRLSPRAAGLRAVAFGPQRLRERAINSIAKTVRTLEALFPPSEERVKSELERLGIVPPDKTLQSLRDLAGMLEFINGLPRISGVRTIEEAVRFFLCAYVEDVTGKPHNKEVAALAGCALGTSQDEVAHGMWRKRNFARLEKALARPRPITLALADFLRRNVT